MTKTQGNQTFSPVASSLFSVCFSPVTAGLLNTSCSFVVPKSMLMVSLSSRNCQASINGGFTLKPSIMFEVYHLLSVFQHPQLPYLPPALTIHGIAFTHSSRNDVIRHTPEALCALHLFLLLLQWSHPCCMIWMHPTYYCFPLTCICPFPLDMHKCLVQKLTLFHSVTVAVSEGRHISNFFTIHTNIYTH